MQHDRQSETIDQLINTSLERARRDDRDEGEDARDLLIKVQSNWAQGICNIIELAKLLTDRRQRLLETGEHPHSVCDKLSAWLASCLQRPEDKNAAFPPSPADIAAILRAARLHYDDDGLERPGFFDLAARRDG